MEKCRVLPQFDMLEKCTTGKSSFKTKDDEISFLKTLTSKILNLLEGNERSYRDTIVKNPGYLDALVNTLQSMVDPLVTFNMVKIVNEIVGKTNSQKRAQLLVYHGVTKALLQCIYLESKEANPSEEYLLLLHQVLYRVGIKDKKIGVRARLCQCLNVILNLIRSQIISIPQCRLAGCITFPAQLTKVVINLLQVLKLYCQNLINTSRLGRNGVIALLIKIICNCGRSNVTILKLSLDCLHLCVRTKSNSARALNQGAMPLLLELFTDWCKYETKEKQYALRKFMFNIIKSLINLKSGKRAFLEADGLHTLYAFCDSNRHEVSMEPIVTTASLIMRKCFPKNRLPLVNYGSTLRCPLPIVNPCQRSKLLTDDFRKLDLVPCVSRSESPIEVDRFTSTYSAEGDVDTYDDYTHIGADKNLDDENQYSDDSSTVDEKVGGSDRNKRQQAKNLFRSLDQKISMQSKRIEIQKRHQSYLNRYSELDSFDTTKEQASGDYDDPTASCFLNPFSMDKCDTFDQIIGNGSCYKPKDDRPIELLMDCYEKFLFERHLPKPTVVAKSEEYLKKTSLTNGMDNSERNEKLVDRIASKDVKRQREVLMPSIVYMQSKLLMNDKKLTRASGLRSDLSIGNSSMDKSVSLPKSLSTLDCTTPSCSTIMGLYDKSRKYSANAKVDIKMNNVNNNSISLSKGNDSTNEIKGENLIETIKEESSESENIDNSDVFTDTYIKMSCLFSRALGRFNLIAYPDLFEKSFTMKDDEPLSDAFLCSINNNQNNTSGAANNNNNANKTKFRGSKRNSTSKKTKWKNNSHGTKAGNLDQSISATQNIEYLAQNKILDDLRRVVDAEDILEKVVYDLDEIVQNSASSYNSENSKHSNADELELDTQLPLITPHLQFESQFECGNLRKAIQIRQYEYDLILSPDINSNHHIQWFYFRVVGMESDVPYRFNIINCEKPNSQFNFGMQPLFFSVKEAMFGRGKWHRRGSEIFYYKNHFARSAATCGGSNGKSYYTCTFIIKFPHAGDVCYLAYHYPYTYSRLLTDIHLWTCKVKSKNSQSTASISNDENIFSEPYNIEFQSVPENGILFSIQELCTSILGNFVPILTISNWNSTDVNAEGNAKKYVFLTSRVHPGESNSSWIIKGCIDFLLSDSPAASQLRDQYIFKIVPMLNPDGVINGCHRCSMAAQDLNRKWLDPCEYLNPTIYHTKGVMMLLTKHGQVPFVFCDFHGHSRRKNVFMFGCSALQSWISEDVNNPTYIDQKIEDQNYLTLPTFLNYIAPPFSIDCCNFNVEKVKETTARVVVWRQFGVLRSYTMESTYCSCDQGVYKHLHINVPILQDMGSRFSEALLLISDVGNNYLLKNYSKLASELNEKDLAKLTVTKRPSKEKRLNFMSAEDNVEALSNCIDEKSDNEESISSNGEDIDESDKDLDFPDDDDVDESD